MFDIFAKFFEGTQEFLTLMEASAETKSGEKTDSDIEVEDDDIKMIANKQKYYLAKLI